MTYSDTSTPGDRSAEGWFITYTGKKFYPLEPRTTDICREDIAHALAQICRFGGHCSRFYSVAQHSVMVSKLLPKRLALWGLLHDAAEAYVGDMVRPLKMQMPGFVGAEHNIEEYIAAAFDLPALTDADRALIKEADNCALLSERNDLIKWGGEPWLENETQYSPVKILVFLPPMAAEATFLERWREIEAP